MPKLNETMRWHASTLAHGGPKGRGLKQHWAHALFNEQLRSKVIAK